MRRAGYPVTYFTDDLLECEAESGLVRAMSASMLRRSIVASTRMRFFVGEPSHLASPELRVWARRYFRFTGALSGLSRFRPRPSPACLASHRARRAASRWYAAGGSGFAAPVFERALEASSTTPVDTCTAAYHLADSWLRRRDRERAARLFDEAWERCKEAG